MFTTEIYSARQLSPFNGNIQILSTPFARALTANGTSWQIQTICEFHQQQWNINNNPSLNRRYIVYGSWNNKLGLTRHIIDPTLDVPDESLIHQHLIAPISSKTLHLPFPAKDNYELWLLDDHHFLPVALLASATCEDQPGNISTQRRWYATKSLPNSSQSYKHYSSQHSFHILEAIINQQISPSFNYQWFLRLPDNSAIAQTYGKNEYHSAGQQLAASLFPQLPLKSDWGHPQLNNLCQVYLDHLSPRLLSLQNLPAELRSTLEHACQKQPEEVLRFHKLYPEIINKKLINKLLVEAELRKSRR